MGYVLLRSGWSRELAENSLLLRSLTRLLEDGRIHGLRHSVRVGGARIPSGTEDEEGADPESGRCERGDSGDREAREPERKAAGGRRGDEPGAGGGVPLAEQTSGGRGPRDPKPARSELMGNVIDVVLRLKA